jgi:myo-inositol-1(or 4)-monophosphatase
LKGAQDWLTEADGAVERMLSERLARAYPHDGFQGEEAGRARGGSIRWVVDPIDGTANFMRGSRRFCVSLGCLDGDAPLIGVIVAPALEETFAARQGFGATLNGTPIRAAETVELARATVELGWSQRCSREAFLTLTDRVIAAGAMPRLNGSGALGLADVAAGRIDAYAELHINLWDVAAVLTILGEAGAAVSAFMSGDGPSLGNPILAAAPGIAVAISAAISIPL